MDLAKISGAVWFIFFFKVTFVEHVVGVGRCVLVPLHFICCLLLNVKQIQFPCHGVVYK